MLRTAIISLLLFLAIPAQAAGPRAAQLVADLAAELRSLGRYEVRFAIDAGGQSHVGSYAVDGDTYHLRFDKAELYGDSAIRYEVDNSRREVTIAPVEASAASLVDNPARAFDLLAAGYSAELQSESEGRAVVVLRPKGAAAAEVITATLATSPLRPVELLYDYDGVRLAIRILALARRTEPVPRFDAARYADYEMIDFR